MVLLHDLKEKQPGKREIDPINAKRVIIVSCFPSKSILSLIIPLIPIILENQTMERLIGVCVN